MNDEHQTRHGRRRQGYVVAREETPPERMAVLHFLIRPHGLEPGKALNADMEQALLAPPSVPDLLYEMKEARRQSDHLEIATIIYLALTALAVTGIMVSRIKEVDRLFCGALFVGALGIATLDSTVQFFKIGTAQAVIARLMARYHDLRVVGPLTDALRLPDEETRHLSALALRYLLPRLDADDADLLNEPQRNILYRHLRGRDIELSLAILKALEQIGDAKALPHVERLADASERADSRVRKASEECLPYLLLRVEREIAPRILLRASGNTETSPETLLRTATGPIAAEADLLLRSPSPQTSTSTALSTTLQR